MDSVNRLWYRKYDLLVVVVISIYVGILSICSVGISRAWGGSEQWEEIRGKARGQEVHWYAWGGNRVYNRFIEWVVREVGEEYGISVVHVKVADTSEAVRKVLSGNIFRGGSGGVDLIWINGENFRILKEEGALFNFVDKLPNSKYLDFTNNILLREDFTIKTEGYELPWGLARLVYYYDSSRVEEVPLRLVEWLGYVDNRVGRLSYIAPPHFLGTTFLKQLLLELVEESGDSEALYVPIDNNFKEVTASLWEYLDKLHPLLWREGKEFPGTEGEMIKLVDGGILDVGYSFTAGIVSLGKKRGDFGASVRGYISSSGTLSNVNFVAIPDTSTNKEGAMVLSNFLISTRAQSRRMDTNHWGEMPVISLDKLSISERELFSGVSYDSDFLGDIYKFPLLREPHPEWSSALREEWLRRYTN